ncbi:tripeptide aminopeptidase [Orenia metallireducens]|jgi:tripeptide aminopeptidase|uniref:Tripeptide aminopeptidase n=1 Tax=Orenia metallireducens TaxID=1413210 RepID=A0A285HMD1_9FIRM|nr:M20/M25/M40 family metallo-hydrolase [Orenia metallireducens]PRX26948.1 tripeptide aminopeptidase [Orenia metallireducens]SNY36847.1 tripeptide aminopeptidase [Orenia metallireducens]
MNQERIIKQFLELVQIDSISKEEGKVADYLVGVLEELGLEVTRDDAGKKVGGETGNIIAKLAGDATKPKLLLSAHMDTVTPGRGIKPIIKDGVIYSEGETILASDDKAGITTILEALRLIKENDIDHGALEVVFTIGEEVGLLGAKNLDYSLVDADFGIAFDSGGEIGTIVTQAPSQDKINVKVIGKAAHAGMNPSSGINAIKVASVALSNMKLGQIDEDTTANIGVIRGGQATNIVPDLVELEGEARSLRVDKLDRQTEHMADIFERSAAKFNAKVEIDVERMYPAFDLSRNSQIVDIAVKAARAIEIKPLLQSTGGGSDANIFNGKGIPTINISVGMTDVHSIDENIKVDDLLNAVKFCVSMIREATR